MRIKRRGFSGTKGFLFPLIKLVCSSSMSSSVPHKIAALEEAVPVPFRHNNGGEKRNVLIVSVMLPVRVNFALRRQAQRRI